MSRPRIVVIILALFFMATATNVFFVKVVLLITGIIIFVIVTGFVILITNVHGVFQVVRVT